MNLNRYLPSREMSFMVMYSLTAVLCYVGCGTTMGYPSTSLPILMSNTSTFTLDDEEIPLFASLPYISQIIGSLLSIITMRYGRRVAIITASFVCTVGWIIITFSFNIVPLFIGRFISGLAVGLSASPVTVYVGEISSNEWRTVLTSSANVFYAVGILLVFALGYLLPDNWQAVAGLCSIVPAISFISVSFYLPESPTWLLMEGRRDEAKVSFYRIRGLRQETAKYEAEFKELINYVNELKQSPEHESSVSEKRMFIFGDIVRQLKELPRIIRLPEVWKSFVILNTFFLCQQFTGLYVIIAYATDVVSHSGITINPFLVGIILGFAQLAGAIFSVASSAKIGRRPLSIISTIGMTISLMILGVNLRYYGRRSVSTLSLISVVLFVLFGSFGLLIIPWAMLGELYPSEYVDGLGAVTTCLASIFNFVAIQLYPEMAENMNCTIYFYCIITALTTIFVILCLPETRGKTMMEVVERFRKPGIVVH